MREENMQDEDVREIIEEAIGITVEMNPQDTDGVWLEDLTVQLGPYIKEWDIGQCYDWSEWPERDNYFPGTTKQDVGINHSCRSRDNHSCRSDICSM